MKRAHIPVLLSECLEFFKDTKLPIFFDATLGAGGHAEAILKNHPEIELFLGCDRDKQALRLAEEKLKPWQKKIEYFHGDFRDLDLFLEEKKIDCVNGFFFDLGASSMQFEEKRRGFSFSGEAPLDMRMDINSGLTAAQVVNEYPEKKLAEIFRDLGEVPKWKIVAKAIVKARNKKRIETTKQLVEIVEPVLRRRNKRHLHPATLVFQALRLYVNQELESIDIGIRKALERLCSKGRIGAISFHSLEDRIVKNLFRDSKIKGEVQVLTKKPIRPTFQETRENRRSRSARLRFAEKVSAM